jgi:hypothetical protein
MYSRDDESYRCALSLSSLPPPPSLTGVAGCLGRTIMIPPLPSMHNFCCSPFQVRITPAVPPAAAGPFTLPAQVPATPAPITAVKGIVPTLQNIVATVNLDCRLDLKTISSCRHFTIHYLPTSSDHPIQRHLHSIRHAHLVPSPLASPTSPTLPSFRPPSIQKSLFPDSSIPGIVDYRHLHHYKKPIKIIEPPKNYHGACFDLNLTQAELSRLIEAGLILV